MALSVKRILKAYSRHDGADTVSILVRTAVYEDTTTIAESDAEVYGSDAALQTAAEAAGKTTWDENVICAVHGLERAGGVL